MEFFYEEIGILPNAYWSNVVVRCSRANDDRYVARNLRGLSCVVSAQSANFSAWMSGWFNQKSGYVFVDLNAYERNVANVKSWCASNPTQTVMAGLQRATAK